MEQFTIDVVICELFVELFTIKLNVVLFLTLRE